VLLVSSCHVYAPVPRGRATVAEDAPLGPTGGYGRTKLAAESELTRAVADEGLDAVIVRAFQQAGPRQDPRLMLSEWCRQMLAPGTAAVRVKSLDSYFDMSDVRDVVRAYRLLAAQGRRGEIYNVGSGVCWRSGDLFERLRVLAGCDRPAVEVAPGATQQPVADTTRLHGATGWRPEIPIDRTLADTWAFWQAVTADHADDDPKPFSPG
jgi:GDP-4-dehydro-6-deoxy-D-mannose reductase